MKASNNSLAPTPMAIPPYKTLPLINKAADIPNWNTELDIVPSELVAELMRLAAKYDNNTNKSEGI